MKYYIVLFGLIFSSLMGDSAGRGSLTRSDDPVRVAVALAEDQDYSLINCQIEGDGLKDSFYIEAKSESQVFGLKVWRVGEEDHPCFYLLDWCDIQGSRQLRLLDAR